MKLKNVGILIASSVLFLSGVAEAKNNAFAPYIGAEIGVGATTLFHFYDAGKDEAKNETDFSESYGAVLGIDIPVLRLELEYNYINDDPVKLQTGLFNLYAKLPMGDVYPYFGGGVGSLFGGNTFIENVSMKSGLVYQMMIGLTFNVPRLPIKIDAEGRCLYAPNIYEYKNHEPDAVNYDLRLKLRYAF